MVVTQIVLLQMLPEEGGSGDAPSRSAREKGSWKCRRQQCVITLPKTFCQQKQSCFNDDGFLVRHAKDGQVWEVGLMNVGARQNIKRCNDMIQILLLPHSAVEDVVACVCDNH